MELKQIENNCNEKKIIEETKSSTECHLKELYMNDQNEIYVEEDVPYEEENAKRGFFLSSLSIDETRLSVLIICLLLSMIFGGVNYILVGDITANLTNIIITLIYAIAGVNITSSIVNSFNKNGEKSEMIVSAKECDEDEDNKQNNTSKKRKFSLKKIFSI